MDMEVADVVQNLPPISTNHKPSKKEAKLMQQRLDKLARVTNHLPALFDAVQHGYLEKARTILESTDVDVNSLNTDGLSPLDIAVLSNNRPLVKMLVSFGAKEGCQFNSTDKFGLHLKQLLGEAEMRLQELGGYLDEPCGALPNNRASFSSIIGNAYPTTSVTVQWSTRADFSVITGEKDVIEITNPYCRIELTQGRRFHGKLKKLDQLMGEVRQFRPGSEILEMQGPQRRAQRKKTTIKQLFTAASKFQKNLRSSLYPDLYWFMKVACSWDDTKTLRSDMEKNTSSGIHFRSKLLSAVLQMQSSLCLQDLGQVYYKPLKDAHGTVVISTINYVFKKLVLSDDHNISEILMASIQEQINYHQVSSLRLGRGLYLAYLKMQSSMDLIQVVVSAKSPNMLPHCKIRDNPHRNARSADNIDAVRQSVQETPRQSISRRAQELGLSQTSTWRILRRDLGLHPYKIQLT
ncbi:unnamed protein product [Phaedon cochleariae]|uniref:Uncharacterized protein n=1 Tax=Phaedon cochleariae TaxID=80249 RepID=A0A9N9SAF1_PHACE|nr:unnamed protein product [Phaedon cochleariae]